MKQIFTFSPQGWSRVCCNSLSWTRWSLFWSRGAAQRGAGVRVWSLPFLLQQWYQTAARGCQEWLHSLWSRRCEEETVQSQGKKKCSSFWGLCFFHVKIEKCYFCTRYQLYVFLGSFLCVITEQVWLLHSWRGKKSFNHCVDARGSQEDGAVQSCSSCQWNKRWRSCWQCYCWSCW